MRIKPEWVKDARIDDRLGYNHSNISGDASVLEASQLQAVRDDRILFAGLSFRLLPGEILQITGPNGAGKTTLLNMIVGLASSEAGEIAWRGRPLVDDPTGFAKDTLWLGHLPGLKLMLTARENLRWMAQLAGKPLTDDRLEAALKNVRLSGYEDVPLARMSAGQKRRVGLARLFAEDKPLWVLDEPFTAIDRAGVGELEAWLGEHAAAGGMILLTTHHDFSPAFPIRRLDVSQFRPVEVH